MDDLDWLETEWAINPAFIAELERQAPFYEVLRAILKWRRALTLIERLRLALWLLRG